ncbi:MAG: hypothetical protein WA359_05340 [Acidimicrobiales bacterium]
MSSSQVARSLETEITCASCLADLEHCHGVAIVGASGAECSDDPDCSVAADLHHFISYED